MMKNAEYPELCIPFSYEEIVGILGPEIAKMTQFIVPVEKFEQQIVRIISDMNRTGYLLLFYGRTGMGKSIFIKSLEEHRRIPVKKLIEIDTTEYEDVENPEKKLKRLYLKLKEIANQENKNNIYNKKTCIILNYLETVQEEEFPHVKAFFRNLNSLLRKTPILVIWP